MKRSLVIVLLVCAALAAGVIVYHNKRKAPSASPPVEESTSDSAIVRPARVLAADEAQLRSAPQNVDQTSQGATAIPASTEATPNQPVTPTPFSQAIDTLISSEASFQQKQTAWKQLLDADQLDQAIETLKQGAAENPSSAAYPAALGQAQLQKAGVISRKGGSISEMGLLGMQADQSFDAALKVDPANWEAQYFKALAMSHWPVELNRGDEVIRRLSSLIDQQETMGPKAEFAQTYVVLGDQYQKMGKTDFAAATWQLGAQKFPGNPALQQKIRGQ